MYLLSDDLMEEDNPTASQKVFLEVQMKANAAVVGGFLEEALKDRVGAQQLKNIIGPPYFEISDTKKALGFE